MLCCGTLWFQGILEQGIWSQQGRCLTGCRTRTSCLGIPCRTRNAFDVFRGMRKKDLVSWNTIIIGLAMHGYAVDALDMFAEMKVAGVKPDGITPSLVHQQVLGSNWNFIPPG
ncbi:hypothetical protein Droror1_Dr00003885 [Drosera rotundifolia]